jgi:hypothetical protein
MKIAILLEGQENAHIKKVLDHVVKGLGKLAVENICFYNSSRDVPPTEERDIIIVWSYRKAEYLKSIGYDVLVSEMSYLGNRYNYISLCWNGLNNYGKFYEYPNDNGVRFFKMQKSISDWISNDAGYVLILGQVPGDMSLRDTNLQKLYLEWIQILEDSNEKVIFRHHPESLKFKKIWNIPEKYIRSNSLQEALSDAKYTLCFNSNSSLDSILNGIPCVAMDSGTMVYDICGKNIGEIITPPREKILFSLAWKQFTIHEIAEGWPLKNLLEMKDRNK